MLQDSIDSLQQIKLCIIMGDFNSQIGNTPATRLKQCFSEDTLNENGELMTQFCTSSGL